MISIKKGVVFCSVNNYTEQNAIREACKYKQEIYKPGRWGKNKIIVEGSMVRHKRFLTGLLNRVEKYCENMGIDIQYDFNTTTEIPAKQPLLNEIEFREDQLACLQEVEKKQRGIIKFPTGTGKTVIAGGICSMYPAAKILFLCHTLDLLTQTYDEFCKWGLKNVYMLGGGNMITADVIKSPCIIVATIQTAYKLDPKSFKNFDIVIVDEAHHVRAGTSYSKLLEDINAPIRIGLTATPPKTGHASLVIEGYFGPIISELSIPVGIEMGIIAKPIIDLIAVPYISRLGELKNYRDIYRKAVMENDIRNHLILQYTADALADNKSILVLIGKEIEHGRILSEMAKEVFNLDMPFLYGGTTKEDRSDYKELLKSKELKCAIANVIWYEGINIPPIDIIINAEGGKASGKTLQKVGRGLRTAEGKTHLTIVDFLDPYKYLSHHCVLRLSTYAEQGWLKPF